MDAPNPFYAPLQSDETPAPVVPAPRLLRGVPRPPQVATEEANPLFAPLEIGAGGSTLGSDFVADQLKRLETGNPPVSNGTIAMLQALSSNVATGDGTATEAVLREVGVNLPVVNDPAMWAYTRAKASAKYTDLLTREGLTNVDGPGVEDAKQSILGAAVIAQQIQDADLPFGPDRYRLISSALNSVLTRRLNDINDKRKAYGGQATQEEMDLAAYANVLMNMSDDQKTELLHHSIWTMSKPPNNTNESAVLEYESGSWTTPTLTALNAALDFKLTSKSSVVENPKRIDGRTALGALQAILGPRAAEQFYDEVTRNKTNFYWGKLGLGNRQNIDGTWSDDGTNFIALTPAGNLQKLVTAKLASSPEEMQNVYALRSRYGLEGARALTAAQTKQILDTEYQKAAAEITAVPVDKLATDPSSLTPAERERLPYDAVAIKFLMDVMAPVISIPSETLRQTENALNGSAWYTNNVRKLAKTVTHEPAMSQEITRMSEVLALIWKGHPEAHKIEYFSEPGEGRVFMGEDLGYAKIETKNLLPYVSQNDPALKALPMDVQKRLLYMTEGAQKDVEIAFPRFLEHENKSSARIAAWRNGTSGQDYGKLDLTKDLLTSLFATNLRQVMDPLTMVLDDPTTAPGLALGIYSGARAFQGAQALGQKGYVYGALAARRAGVAKYLSASKLRVDLSDVINYHPEKLEGFRRIAKEQMRAAPAGDASVGRLQELQGALTSAIAEQRRVGILSRKEVRNTIDLLVNTWNDLVPEMGDLGKMLGSDKVTRSVITQIRDAKRLLMGEAPTRPNKFISLALAESEEAGLMPGLNEAIRASKDILGTATQENGISMAVQAWTAKNPGQIMTSADLATMLPESDYATLHGMIMAGENTPKIATNWLHQLGGRLFGWKNLEKMTDIFRGTETVANNLVLSVQFNQEQKVARNLAVRQNRIITSAVRGKVQAQIEALDLHSRLLEMEIKNPSSGINASQEIRDIFVEEYANTAQKLSDLRARERLLAKHIHEVGRGGVEAPVNFPRELGIQADLTPELAQTLLQLHPGEFGGLLPEAIFEDVLKRDVPREKALLAHKNAVEARVEKQRPIYEEAKNPETGWKHDSRYRRAGEAIQKYQELKKGLKGKDTGDAMVLDGTWEVDASKAAEYDRMIEELKFERKQRRLAIKSKHVRPDGLDAIEGEFESLREQHRAATSEYNDIKDGLVFKRVPRPGALAGMSGRATYSGFILNKDSITSTISQLGAVGGPRTQLRGTNPFMFQRFPMWLKGELVRDFTHGTANWTQSYSFLVDEHTQEVNKMGRIDRRILGRAQAEGSVLPSDFVKRNPRYMRIYEKLYGTEVPDRLANLDSFYNSEQALFQDYWRAVERGGAVPEHVMQSWRKLNYDPHLYAGLERAKLIRDVDAREEISGMAGARSGKSFGLANSIERDNLKFQRVWDKYRVKVVEKDVVVDKQFDTLEQAHLWVQDNYGKTTVRNLGPSSNGVREGKTIWGDHIAVSDPITAADRKMLDAVRGETAIARLRSLKQGFRDISTQYLFDSLDLYGNMVLSESQFSHLKSVGNYEVAKMYEKLPPQRELFGSLAGKRVHKGVLAEINRASHSFDILDNAMEGIRESWMESYGQLSESIVKKTSKIGKAFDWVNEFARTNLILKSIRTWTNNVMFSTFSDHMAGSEVFTAKGWQTLMDSWETVTPGFKGLRPDADGSLRAARELGIVSGAFEDRNFAYRKVMADAMGVGTDIADLPKLAKKLAERERLLDSKISENPKGNWYELERDVWTLRRLVREREQNWMQRYFKKITSLFWKQSKSLQGIPNAGVDQWLRARYAAIDDAFKLAQFRNLRGQGLPDAVAAQQVKLYSQMYNEIPWYVRAIPSPVRSLVTSFPYELLRISANAMANRPARMLGFFSVIPAINMMNATLAGVNYDRLDAILRARGAKDGLSQATSFLSSLMAFNPRNGELDWTADFKSVVPLPELIGGRGVLVSAFDAAIPREGRGLMATLASAGVGVASNFVGNNIAFNAIGLQLTGLNPLTGEPMFSNDMSPIQRQGAVLKQLAQNILPPVYPFGRDWNRMQDAFSSVAHPGTGKRYMGENLATESLRSLTGIVLRGTMAEAIVEQFGAVPMKRTVLAGNNEIMRSIVHESLKIPFMTGRPDTAVPAIGEWKESRKFIARALDQRLPEAERDEAMKKAWDHLQEGRTVSVAGYEVTGHRTDKQIRNEIRKLSHYDIEDLFGMVPIAGQAFALMAMQQAQIPEKDLQTLVNAMLFSDSMKPKIGSDVGQVNDALTFLKSAVDKPNSSPAIRKAYQWTLNLVPAVKAMEDVQQIRQANRDVLLDEVRRARRNVRP